jgi:hypothetical protein
MEANKSLDRNSYCSLMFNDFNFQRILALLDVDPLENACLEKLKKQSQMRIAKQNTSISF